MYLHEAASAAGVAAITVANVSGDIFSTFRDEKAISLRRYFKILTLQYQKELRTERWINFVYIPVHRFKAR